MTNKASIKDIWTIYYNVPNKKKSGLLRPFVVVNIIDNNVYGIPLTSFKQERYREELGDFILETHFLNSKSIIKPYQIIKIKEEFFKNKIGSVDDQIINKINKSIDCNVVNYLSMKNINAITRDYIIERQIRTNNLLELRVQTLEKEIENLRIENQFLKQEKESKEDEFELEID